MKKILIIILSLLVVSFIAWGVLGLKNDRPQSNLNQLNSEQVVTEPSDDTEDAKMLPTSKAKVAKDELELRIERTMASEKNVDKLESAPRAEKVITKEIAGALIESVANDLDDSSEKVLTTFFENMPSEEILTNQPMIAGLKKSEVVTDIPNVKIVKKGARKKMVFKVSKQLKTAEVTNNQSSIVTKEIRTSDNVTESDSILDDLMEVSLNNDAFSEETPAQPIAPVAKEISTKSAEVVSEEALSQPIASVAKEISTKSAEVVIEKTSEELQPPEKNIAQQESSELEEIPLVKIKPTVGSSPTVEVSPTVEISPTTEISPAADTKTNALPIRTTTTVGQSAPIKKKKILLDSEVLTNGQLQRRRRPKKTMSDIMNELDY